MRNYAREYWKRKKAEREAVKALGRKPLAKQPILVYTLAKRLKKQVNDELRGGAELNDLLITAHSLCAMILKE